MEEKKNLHIPKEIVDQLGEHPNATVDLDMSTGNATLVSEQQNFQDSQKISLRGFMIPSVIASIVFFIYFYFYKNMSTIPLNGGNSIGQLMSTVGVISGLVSLTLTFIWAKKGKIQSESRRLYWRNFPPILISFAIILFLGSLFLFRILNYMFPGMKFDLFTSTFLFFILVAMVNYTMIYTIMRLTPALLTNILTLVIIGGVFGAMVTNRERQWWQHNFSFLGTIEAKNSWQFNLTLILSGVLMIALIDYLYVNLETEFKGWRLSTLRWILILIAINLGAVGAFPYKENSINAVIHNQVAANLVYLVIILIVALGFLIPNLSKEFKITSFVIMGLLILTLFLFQGVHYFSLTAFEFIAFLIAFAWLIMLFQYLQGMLAQKEERSFVTVYLTNMDTDTKSK